MDCATLHSDMHMSLVLYICQILNVDFFPRLRDLALNCIDYFSYMVHGTELVAILQFNYLFVFFIKRISLFATSSEADQLMLLNSLAVFG